MFAGVIKKKIWKFGDNINTDLIFPGKYLYEDQNPTLLATYALEPLLKDFYKKISAGDFLVAGVNFGCGSSREQAATALKYAGVGAVIAKSFGRIFFRNAITHGLPVITCPEFVDSIENGDDASLDWSNSKLFHDGSEFTFQPLGKHVEAILRKGGLLPYLEDRFQR